MPEQAGENPFEVSRPKGRRSTGDVPFWVFVVGCLAFTALGGIVSWAVYAWVSRVGWGWLPPDDLVSGATLGLAAVAAISIVLENRKEAKGRAPNLKVVILDGTKEGKPVEEGFVVALRNLGPGVARDVRVNAFLYPASPEVVPGWKDHLGSGTLATSLTVPFLDPIQAHTQVIHTDLRGRGLGTVEPQLLGGAADHDYFAELTVMPHDAFGTEVPPSTETLRHTLEAPHPLEGFERRRVWVLVDPQEAVRARERAEEWWRSPSAGTRGAEAERLPTEKTPRPVP